MSTKSPVVQDFLEGYERSRNSFDVGLIDSQYPDACMFAGPAGAMVTQKSAILARIPKGQELFTALGHKSTKLVSSTETKLDEHYTMVRARFVWRFAKPAPADPIDVEVDTSFILFIKDGEAKIVFQQEHEDFFHALRARGVLPPAE
jgi:hypothetical protein